MLVKWKGDGINSVKPIDSEMKDPAAAALVQSVLLYPGWNDVPDNIWDKCKIHLVDMFARGMIEEKSKKDKDEEGNDIYIGKSFADVAARDPQGAVEIVRECYNTAVLASWIEMTSRDEVRSAIKTQIEKCELGIDTK
jgi:hypothetical protein